ncbi:MFS transporter [Dyella solisilvae]|uniref:MFS transporter n=1 Tax=Dyella solisilvae TaxID=1920168 RepID=A0A370K9C2_9GAMM|nr:DHA2 family efflux MFS transporter permease subunit [Dyella solisilvae]RDI99047.1 MFS transporter [Dyella solisilvae]
MSSEFRPPNLALTTIGLSLATFMQVLDTTIANVSLPTIAGNLGVSVNQSTWVITSFAVSTAIALPLTGFLTRRVGEVRLFIWSTLLFSVASFLCGTAQSMPMLILFRALQGAVAGPMYPITQALLISIYPPAKRGMALALLAMVTVVAPIAGPILGGWITDNYSWPWIFFINVPIGIFASMVVGNQMKLRVDQISKPKVDYVGLITLIIGVGALQIVLDKGNDEDWFSSPFIVITTIVSVIALAIFLIWELTDDEPIVNLRLLRHHNFRVGTIALVLAYAAFFAIGLLVPQWLQRNLGYTSTWAGFAAAPLGILPVMLTFIVGKYASRTDMRLLASCAFLVMGATCFMRSNFFVQVDFWHIAGVQLFQGLGVALFFMPVTTILLSDLRPNEIASGGGLATFLRTLGASFSASLTTFLWDHRAIVHHAHLAEKFSPYDSTAQTTLQQAGVTGQAGNALLDQLIIQQGYQISFNEVFRMLGWVFLCLIVVVWMARPPFTAKAGASADH